MSYTNGLDKPSDFMDTVLYTGNGSSQNIGGLDFQPDWVWIKSRSLVKDHDLYDSVRGADFPLESNTDVAEQDAGGQGLTSFRSDGFAIGNRSTINSSSATQVSWNWKAGTSFTNDASATGIGSIDSAGSVNTDAGFSIVSYTGTGSTATVGHGLGTAPAMILIKGRSFVDEWLVYHQSMGNTHAINLNLNNASSSSINYWRNTTPSSSVVYIGANDKHNKSSETYIAYCFAEKQGYSKFGSYTGNGNANGTFVYTGFKPALVICKKADSDTNDWFLMDNKRNGFNGQNYNLEANTNEAEQSNSDIDILSNGFKTRSSGNGHNTNGHGYIYMAFAENPFVTSTGVPATAR